MFTLLQLVCGYKFGVINVREGQTTEEEFYSNSKSIATISIILTEKKRKNQRITLSFYISWGTK